MVRGAVRSEPVLGCVSLLCRELTGKIANFSTKTGDFERYLSDTLENSASFLWLARVKTRFSINRRNKELFEPNREPNRHYQSV